MAFSDGDDRLTTVTTKLNDKDLHFLIQYLLEVYNMDIDITPDLIEQIKKETGNIARNVCRLFELWCPFEQKDENQTEELASTNLLPNAVLATFNFDLRQYYAARIQSLLARHVDDLTRISELQFIARLIVGGIVSFNFCGNGFEAAGLISNDGKIVCRQAKEAILSVFNLQRPQLISELASFPQTSWYALEVAFLSAFQPFGKSVIVPVKDSMGNPLKTEVALEFLCVRQQERLPKAEIEITSNKLKNGDLLILSVGHTTLDFVGVNLEGLLILGQISQTKYDGLTHCFWDLFDKKIGDLSMINFYRSCAGKPLLCQSQRTLPQDTIYLYVTSSTKFLSKQSQAADDPVVVVDGTVLTSKFAYPRELIPENIPASRKRQRQS
ncbi:uncharacterized protein VTP21DRAFT_1113 [Calcarisporiella thermophila]|uniref:uncharacterized protein n=1 Tax=Calcarisporiella thermophila TaxID=911321 RepID=UPI0037426295